MLLNLVSFFHHFLICGKKAIQALLYVIQAFSYLSMQLIYLLWTIFRRPCWSAAGPSIHIHYYSIVQATSVWRGRRRRRCRSHHSHYSRHCLHFGPIAASQSGAIDWSRQRCRLTNDRSSARSMDRPNNQPAVRLWLFFYDNVNNNNKLHWIQI